MSILSRAAGFSVLFISWLGASAGIRYVNIHNPNPAAPYGNWDTASTNLQSAISGATGGDEIWVAAGIYYENITVSNDVALYGGFAGTETTLNQRDWKNLVTILDGRFSNSVVVIAPGVTHKTRIDGFTIRNGRASSGGGILALNASPSIFNNTIFGNRATNGGGIFCDQAAPLIVSNNIQNNCAATAGGGVYCSQSSATIRNNRFIGNSVCQSQSYKVWGGAISIECGQGSDISENLIFGNYLVGDFAFGGGIYATATESSTIRNNTIAWNQVQIQAIPKGGNISCEFNTNLVIANNIVLAGDSGVYADSEQGLMFANNCVYGNRSRDFVNFPSQTGSNGNISVDPQFTPNPDYPDFHLASGSPCRDSGNSAIVESCAVDLFGGLRIIGSAVDIGAIEFGNPAPQFVAAIVRVGPNGHDSNDGSSWSKPKRSVQAGVDLAALTGGEVWVQSGTYAENIDLGMAVHLYGGFFGTETQRSQRNWKTNFSILDGMHCGPVITLSNRVKWNTVDGFRIQNGRAYAGGGIDSFFSTPVIANNLILNNSATNGGGIAARIALGPPLSLDRCSVTNNVISSNQASAGGGVFLSGSWESPAGMYLANNRFERNVVDSGSGPPSGGAVYLDIMSPAIIADNLFLTNIATNQPGQLWCQGAGIWAKLSACQIINNSFLGNLDLSADGNLSPFGGTINTSQGAVVANNLVAFGSIGMTGGGPVGVRNNCVFGNVINYGTVNLTGTNGNISVDPLLVSEDNFHLTANSPCINAGNSSDVNGDSDFDSRARISGGTVDIGVYEFQDPTSALSYAWLQQFSLPTDGSADFVDNDSDGLNNWQEWRAKTSPVDPMSVLKILSITNDVSGPAVTWQSVGGVTYYLQRCDPGVTGAFSIIQSNIPGQPLTTSFTDTNVSGAAQALYRVGVQ